MYLLLFLSKSSVCACSSCFLKVDLWMRRTGDSTSWHTSCGQGCWRCPSVWHVLVPQVWSADLIAINIFKVMEGKAVICKEGMCVGHGWRGGCDELIDVLGAAISPLWNCKHCHYLWESKIHSWISIYSWSPVIYLAISSTGYWCTLICIIYSWCISEHVNECNLISLLRRINKNSSFFTLTVIFICFSTVFCKTVPICWIQCQTPNNTDDVNFKEGYNKVGDIMNKSCIST